MKERFALYNRNSNKIYNFSLNVFSESHLELLVPKFFGSQNLIFFFLRRNYFYVYNSRLYKNTNFDFYLN